MSLPGHELFDIRFETGLSTGIDVDVNEELVDVISLCTHMEHLVVSSLTALLLHSKKAEQTCRSSTTRVIALHIACLISECFILLGRLWMIVTEGIITTSEICTVLTPLTLEELGGCPHLPEDILPCELFLSEHHHELIEVPIL